MKRLGIAALVCFATFTTVHALTWNEPWQEEVLKTSDTFVKVRILSNENNQAKATVLKSLGGPETPSEITVEGYFLLRVFSASSGDALKLPLRANEIYYLFLKKDSAKGSYQLATPTAGIASVSGTDVTATYRHSYHQATVPEDVYEPTMRAVFSGAHGQPYDEVFVMAFLKEQLGQRPSNWRGENDPAQTKRFFLQHVALEMVYHLGKGADLQTLAPFLASSSDHEQISACRAVSRVQSPAAQELMMAFVEQPHNSFAKVMCVWGLGTQDARGFAPRLEAFVKTGPDQTTGFGGSIMDSRVATVFPGTVKEAIDGMLGHWTRTPVAGAR